MPILMLRLGTVNAQRLARYQELGQEPPSLHCPAYYPHTEESLQTGVVTMASTALELLAPPVNEKKSGQRDRPR